MSNELDAVLATIKKAKAVLKKKPDDAESFASGMDLIALGQNQVVEASEAVKAANRELEEVGVQIRDHFDV